jgi:hypothetical protein
MTKPSKAPCGHKFCLTCLEEVLIYKLACPFCRAEIAQDFKPKIDLKLQEDIQAFNKKGLPQGKEYIKKLRDKPEKSFKLKVIYGNNHTGHNSHHWCAYVRLADKNENINKYISKVTFELHPTFTNPKRERTKAPFQASCIGWGTFTIPITIEWNPVLGMNNTKVEHYLSFERNGDHSTFEVIVDKTLLK